MGVVVPVLGVPAPAEPFPHPNDAATVEARLHQNSDADGELLRRVAAG